jgi:hypothetical protein
MDDEKKNLIEKFLGFEKKRHLEVVGRFEFGEKSHRCTL